MTPLRRVARTLCVCLLLGAGTIHAHPHSWIDLQVTVKFNDQGKITALEQRWLMDPFTSAVWLDGLGTDAQGKGLATRLDNAAKEALARIANHNYFIEIRHGGAKLDKVEAQAPQLNKIQERLELQFELALVDPIDPAQAPLRYAVFDPTYYVEILHAESTSIRLEGAGLHCDLHIESPSPDPKRVAYAASLGADIQAEQNLGQHFAEWAEISCARQ